MPIIRQPNPVPVRATPGNLLIVATHLERVADDANTRHSQCALPARHGRNWQRVQHSLAADPFQTLIEQTEAARRRTGKNYDALHADMMDFQARLGAQRAGAIMSFSRTAF